MKFFSLFIGALAITESSAVQDIVMVKEAKSAPNGKWMPDRYSSGDDDQLMKNLIEQGLAFTKDKGFTDVYKFKTEKGCGCSENSCLCCMQKHTHFWIDKKGAFDASAVLVSTNLHMDKAHTASYLDDKFGDLWKKYDVIQTGWIEIERMTMFYKELMGDVTIAIQ